LAEPTHGSLALAVQMRQMLYGHLLSRALCAVAALGVPDMLADGARTAENLATRSGASSASLQHLLRALVAFDVFIEHEDGTFGLTPLGETLRSDAMASALPTATLVGSEIGQAWNEFLWTVRTGRSAFGKLYGTEFFSYLELKPELRTVFDLSQVEGLRLDLEEILRGVDFSGRNVVVDVGGGDGALLEYILAAYPDLHGVLIELPQEVVRARQRLAAAGLADRFEAHAGDIFETVPATGDMYLLRQIMHDWDDNRCAALLAACRRAMPDHAVLVIIDLLVQDKVTSDQDAQMTGLMDLYMMSIFGSCERTRAQLESLLAVAGFRVSRVIGLPGRMMAIEAIPTVTG
jgi:hypothetical protein